jgi:cysteine synthase
MGNSGNGRAMRSTAGRGRLYDSIIDTVGDTPCIRINRLAPEHVELYVKAEFFNPAASVKDRLAINIIEDAERRGTLKPGQTVVEATSGNTGIGLAMACAAKGYPLVVTMADSFSVERRQLMRFLGAKVVLTPRTAKGYGMYVKAKELADANGWFLARQFETEANADIHESTTGREIVADFDGRRLDCFVTGWGTGGTVAGVGRVLRRERPGTRSFSPSPTTPGRRVRHAAGAGARRRSGLEPSRIRAAPDPGLDTRLHSARPPGSDRREVLRRADPRLRRRRHEVGAPARGRGGHHDRRVRRLDLRRRHAGRAEGRARFRHPLHAA